MIFTLYSEFKSNQHFSKAGELSTFKKNTLQRVKTPQNGCLEYDLFPFGMAYFQGQTVSFRECNNISGWFTSFLGLGGAPFVTMDCGWPGMAMLH